MQKLEIKGVEGAISESGAVLGYAVWFTIGKMRIPHNELVKLLIESRITSKLTKPSARATFERICSEMKEKQVRHDVFALVRSLEDCRRVVLEKRGKGVDYESYADLFLDGNRIRVERLGEKKEVAEEFVRELVEMFEKEKDCHTEETVRKLLLETLEKTGKVKLKPSGSIYFVPRDHFAEVEKFGVLFDKLKAHNPRNELWYAPIVDAERTRKMLELKVEETLQNEFERMFMKFVKSPDYKELRENAKKAIEIAEIYENMLQHELLRAKRLYEIARSVVGMSREEAIPFLEKVAVEEKLDNLLKVLTEGEECFISEEF